MSYSASRKRKDSCPIEWVSTLINDIQDVLDKPLLALTIFTIGVAFVFLASWQVNFSIHLLESYGMVNAEKTVSALGNLMSVVVFVFSWVDLILLSYLEDWTMRACRSGFWWLSRLGLIIRRINEEDVQGPQQPAQHRHGRTH